MMYTIIIVPKESGFNQSETAWRLMRTHIVTFSRLSCHGKRW